MRSFGRRVNKRSSKTQKRSVGRRVNKRSSKTQKRSVGRKITIKKRGGGINETIDALIDKFDEDEDEEHNDIKNRLKELIDPSTVAKITDIENKIIKRAIERKKIPFMEFVLGQEQIIEYEIDISDSFRYFIEKYDDIAVPIGKYLHLLTLFIINNIDKSIIHELDTEGNNWIMRILKNFKSQYIKEDPPSESFVSDDCESDVRLINYLIEKNVNMNITNNKGNNPLHSLLSDIHSDFSCEKSIYELINLSIEKGVNVNRKNNDGDTPLHFLVSNVNFINEYTDLKEKEHYEKFILRLITFLITKGADITIQNNNKKTPYDLLDEQSKQKYTELYVRSDQEPLLRSSIQSSSSRLKLSPIQSSSLPNPSIPALLHETPSKINPPTIKPDKG